MEEEYVQDYPIKIENFPCFTSNDTLMECDLPLNMMDIEERIKDLDALINGNSSTAATCPFDDSEQEPCDKRFLHKLLLGYLFPIVLAFCVFGNSANVLTYSGRYLRKSTTVKMLTAKAFLNTLFMVCLIPHFLLLVIDTDGSGRGPIVYYLWASWPYMLFLANICGTSAIW